MSKRRWSDRSAAGKAVAIVLIAVSVLFVLATERDIQRRPVDDIRGSRFLWRLVSLNALGALAYRRFGRRRLSVD
jgi:hypothetical protein